MQPLQFYTFKLAERLHMRQRELIDIMDVKELQEWIAYDRACDPEFKEQTIRQKALDDQKGQTAEEEAAKIISMFQNLGNK